MGDDGTDARNVAVIIGSPVSRYNETGAEGESGENPQRKQEADAFPILRLTSSRNHAQNSLVSVRAERHLSIEAMGRPVMENIDPFILLEPVLFIALGTGLVLYWRLKRRLVGIVILLSLVAYAGAIALKEVIQGYTYNSFVAEFGYVSWQTGLYFGLQTCFLEVGLAYLIARYAVARKLIGTADAEGYGVSLAFWENAVLIGALTLVNLATTYVLIADGLIPQSVYQTIVSSDPGLFLSPQQLAGPIALATLERISSFLVHLAWGYLCVLGAALRKPVYLAIALPMGLIDALVPLAQEIPTWEFEGIIFAFSLFSFAIAWRATATYRQGIKQQAPVAP